MKKTMLALVAVLCLFTFISAVQAEQQSSYVWICPVIAANGVPDSQDVAPIVWSGDYVFQITTDGGETSKKFFNDLESFGHGGLLQKNTRLDDKYKKNVISRALAYRNIKIAGETMTVVRSDGKTMRVNLKGEKNFFRRALYPVEPSADNDWEGWPK